MFLGDVQVGYVKIFHYRCFVALSMSHKGTIENGSAVNSQMEGSSWSTIDMSDFLEKDPQNALLMIVKYGKSY